MPRLNGDKAVGDIFRITAKRTCFLRAQQLYT
uniref:Uncharacterized protein n=1 Tax=Anguilla anguilla TaxID=7936 RepID=A0A0E9VVP6_ANGAN